MSHDELEKVNEPTTYKRRSKLVGYDAWNDIPEYLKRDINICFGTYESKYRIDDFLNVGLVIDYSELLSSEGYSGNVRPGLVVPLGSIHIRYFTEKATGSLANYYCPLTIGKYPRKGEISTFIDKMRETCREWDKELVLELGDRDLVKFLLTDFRESNLAIKDLEASIEQTINDYLGRLYGRLDNVVKNFLPYFRKGRRFGYYEVEVS